MLLYQSFPKYEWVTLASQKTGIDGIDALDDMSTGCH